MAQWSFWTLITNQIISFLSNPVCATARVSCARCRQHLFTLSQLLSHVSMSHNMQLHINHCISLVPPTPTLLIPLRSQPKQHTRARTHSHTDTQNIKQQKHKNTLEVLIHYELMFCKIVKISYIWPPQILNLTHCIMLLCYWPPPRKHRKHRLGQFAGQQDVKMMKSFEISRFHRVVVSARCLNNHPHLRGFLPGLNRPDGVFTDNCFSIWLLKSYWDNRSFEGGI